mgnify:CR=1 FL=1
MFSKIVVPLDGSKAAEAALQPAMFMARAFNAEVKLVAVPEAPMTFGEGDWILPAGSALQEVQEKLEVYLTAQAHALRQEGCSVSTEVLDSGPTTQVLIELLEKDRPDLLILTSHGRSGVTRFLIGSVAENLCRNAPCPVMVVGRHSRLCESIRTQALLGS